MVVIEVSRSDGQGWGQKSDKLTGSQVGCADPRVGTRVNTQILWPKRTILMHIKGGFLRFSQTFSFFFLFFLFFRERRFCLSLELQWSEPLSVAVLRRSFRSNLRLFESSWSLFFRNPLCFPRNKIDFCRSRFVSSIFFSVLAVSLCF